MDSASIIARAKRLVDPREGERKVFGGRRLAGGLARRGCISAPVFSFSPSVQTKLPPRPIIHNSQFFMVSAETWTPNSEPLLLLLVLAPTALRCMPTRSIYLNKGLLAFSLTHIPAPAPAECELPSCRPSPACLPPPWCFHLSFSPAGPPQPADRRRPSLRRLAR